MAASISKEAKGEAEVHQVRSLKNAQDASFFTILLQATLAFSANCKVGIECVNYIIKKYISGTDVHLSHKLKSPGSIKCTPSNVKGIVSAETCDEVQKMIESHENRTGSPITKYCGSMKKKGEKSSQEKKVTHKKEPKTQEVVETNEHHKKVTDSTKKSKLLSLGLKMFCFSLSVIVLALVGPTSAESLVKFTQDKYSASKGAALQIQWHGTWDDRVLLNGQEIGHCNNKPASCGILDSDNKEFKSQDLKLKKIGEYFYELDISEITCFFRNVTVRPTGQSEKGKTADIIVAGCHGNSATWISGPKFEWLVLVALIAVMCQYM